LYSGIKEESSLRNRISDFERETGLNAAIHLTLITTFGLKENIHSSDVVNIVLLDDLFR